MSLGNLEKQAALFSIVQKIIGKHACTKYLSVQNTDKDIGEMNK